MTATLNKTFRDQYPDLWISCYPAKDGITLSVWVRRDNRDHEAIGNVSITDLNLRATLEGWQTESHIAKQGGWFFCSGHVAAEPRTEYGYFHFAGNYCKKYGEENPESKREATRETYN